MISTRGCKKISLVKAKKNRIFLYVLGDPKVLCVGVKQKFWNLFFHRGILYKEGGKRNWFPEDFLSKRQKNTGTLYAPPPPHPIDERVNCVI